jgi:hypothetical protein
MAALFPLKATAKAVDLVESTVRTLNQLALNLTNLSGVTLMGHQKWQGGDMG